jgi:chorismate synthase
MNIVITGAKHSGKTTAGLALSSLCGIPFLDTDSVIVDLYKERKGELKTVREIYVAEGSGYFRDLESDAVRSAAEKDYHVIATGGGVVQSPELRNALFPGSVVVYLRVPEPLLWKRIEANGIPPFYEGPSGRDVHRSRVETIDEIMRSRADIVVSVTEENQETVAEEIVSRVEDFIQCYMKSPSTTGETVRVTTFGESHGRGLGAVLDGIMPGVPLSEDDVQRELDRRRPGQSSVSTPRNEKDRVKILSGVFEGKTTGHPVCMVVMNEDQDSSKYENLRDVFRPGHADLTFWKKYGIRDHRGGGRSSGRETIGRVAPGAVAKKILSERGVSITAFAEEIAGIRAAAEDFSVIESNPVRAADPEAAKLMERAILDAQERKDSVGGVVKCVIKGVPAGLGDPVFFKLQARLGGAVLSLGAVKGIEFGAGFLAARLSGSGNNDAMDQSGFLSNNSGGILGGISTGEDIVFHVAVKPTPSIFREQKTVTKDNADATIEIRGRHDPCIVPRIIPVIESMAALVILDAWETGRRLGGTL